MSKVYFIVTQTCDSSANCIYIEKVKIPPEIYQVIPRELSFLEIVYTGLYSILTQMISSKYTFFKMTHTNKAFNDSQHLLRYRKCVLVSYLVLKHRLDHYATMKRSDPQLVEQMIDNLYRYNKMNDAQHMPYVHYHDSCFFNKVCISCQLNPIEVMSFINFYNTFAQMVHTNELKTTIFPVGRQYDQETYLEMGAKDYKNPPDCRFINLDILPIEYQLFPDYDGELFAEISFHITCVSN